MLPTCKSRNMQLNVPYCQTHIPSETVWASFLHHIRHRFSSKALVMTLTELKAIAAPATTGLK